jgi:outer membrane receptor for ferrienterochelin and colicins
MGQNPVGAEAYTVGGKVLVAPSRQHEFSLAFNSARQDYDNTFGDVGALHRTGAPTASACNSKPFPNFCRGYEQELTFTRNQATLGYTGRFGFGGIDARYTRDQLRTEGRTIPLGSGLAPAIEGSPRQLALDTDIFDLKLLTAFGSHTATLSAQVINPTMTDGLWGGISNTNRQYSVFGEDEWQLTERFALTGGLRYDKNDAFSGEFTPRLYGVWKASSDWTFKGGVGKGFRTPYLEQLTSGIIGFGSQGTVPIFGNPNLRPETSTNVELSSLYAAGPWSAQATMFRSELKDLIEAGTGANTGKSLNLGEATIHGLELAAAFKASAAVTLSGNYAYTRSEVTSTQLDTGNPAQAIARRKGDPLSSVPEHMLNAQVNWQAMPRLNAFLAVEHRSKAFRPRDFHEPQTGGSSQAAVASGVRDSNAVLGDFKGYSLFNVGTSYRISKNVAVNAVIYNLLNKDFKDYVAYNRCANGGCTTFANGFSNTYNNIQEPRRLYVSLNAEF